MSEVGEAGTWASRSPTSCGSASAAARWAEFGHQLERALAPLGAGRCLLTLGHPEGRARLQAARDLLAVLNARPLLAEAGP